MRRVVVAGLFGAVVLMLWMVIVNGIFRFESNINMKQISAEREVYETLKEHIAEPGRYVCNPELTPEGRFPDGEPVFSVLYGGMGHGAAGGLMLVGLVVFILSPMVAAWMLSQTSERVISSYSRKVLFFAAIGLVIAVFSDLMDLGIGSYPVKDAVLLAAHDVVAWTVVGLVVARIIQPRRAISVKR